ncbi:hypothetical protein F5Y19DRAFT_241353 [Xylariaceae sp. FL1651]|nr:hypothetical protein F5Y19DRAFT_241353 [Xylariaceae sp. FL1651]
MEKQQHRSSDSASSQIHPLSPLVLPSPAQSRLSPFLHVRTAAPIHIEMNPATGTYQLQKQKQKQSSIRYGYRAPAASQSVSSSSGQPTPSACPIPSALLCCKRSSGVHKPLCTAVVLHFVLFPASLSCCITFPPTFSNFIFTFLLGLLSDASLKFTVSAGDMHFHPASQVLGYRDNHPMLSPTRFTRRCR